MHDSDSVSSEPGFPGLGGIRAVTPVPLSVSPLGASKLHQLTRRSAPRSRPFSRLLLKGEILRAPPARRQEARRGARRRRVLSVRSAWGKRQAHSGWNRSAGSRASGRGFTTSASGPTRSAQKSCRGGARLQQRPVPLSSPELGGRNVPTARGAFRLGVAASRPASPTRWRPAPPAAPEPGSESARGSGGRVASHWGGAAGSSGRAGGRPGGEPAGDRRRAAAEVQVSSRGGRERRPELGMRTGLVLGNPRVRGPDAA